MYMSDNEVAAFAVFTISASAVVITVAKMFFGRRALKGGDAPSLAGIEQRLARIETAVDAMAVEVERISEGQRFTTRLLSERAGSGGMQPTGGGALPGAATERR